MSSVLARAEIDNRTIRHSSTVPAQPGLAHSQPEGEPLIVRAEIVRPDGEPIAESSLNALESLGLLPKLAKNAAESLDLEHASVEFTQTDRSIIVGP